MSIEGLKKVDSALWRLSRAILIISGEALKLASEVCVSEAQRLAPVKTGRLRDSIRILEDGGGYTVVGSDLHYAPYVEYGTSRMAPKPYLRPAAERARDSVEEFFVEVVSREAG